MTPGGTHVGLKTIFKWNKALHEILSLPPGQTFKPRPDDNLSPSTVIGGPALDQSLD